MSGSMSSLKQGVPLCCSHDSGDNVDMVLLPMEEEIEPVHHMGAGLCAGGVDDNDEFYHDLQLATSGGLRGTNMSHL